MARSIEGDRTKRAPGGSYSQSECDGKCRVFTADKRELIMSLAAKLNLPAIYPYRLSAASSGLISYSYDAAAQWQGSASYVDRILRGAKPSELPVQAPTKYEMIINLKTAKALGLTVPRAMQLSADELIE